MSDAEAFAEFVDARSPRLYRTAFLLTRDWALAEDLLQSTLARVWLAWHRVDHNAEGYAYRTMVREHSSWWRRHWRGEQPTEQLPDRPQLGADADHAEQSIDLWTAVGALPRRQQAVLVVRYFLDYTEADAAVVMGCSQGTVKSQTSKALANLRRSLVEDAARDVRSADVHRLLSSASEGESP